ARCPMTILDAQKAIIPKTKSLAIELGKKVREANESGKNPLEKIEESLPNAKHVFSGTVKRFTRIEEGGFTSGEIFVESLKNASVILKIWYQNEYLLSWLNDEPFVTCPDGFYIVDNQAGYGLTPWENDFIENREISVFIQNAPAIWTSKKGLSVFGPKVFDKKWGKYKKASSYL
ncbi:unnamed protein product, partial [marine sediment metagenome]